MAWAAWVDSLGVDPDALAAIVDEPWAPLRATWGTSPQAIAGHKAMMDLAGGPAPMRERPKPQEPTDSA